MRIIKLLQIAVFFSIAIKSYTLAQELNCKVTINRDAVSNTKSNIFDALQNKLTEFMNTHRFTRMEYQDHERIECSFYITIATYSETDNSFTASAVISASRPVYGSTYQTTFFSTKDNDFSFEFSEYETLELNLESIENNLTAMMAYWAYMIIGFDMDTFSLIGGSEELKTAMKIVEDSQRLGYPGWKSFDSPRNRHGIVNDYMDISMEPFRKLQYEYYRCGLDSMHINLDKSKQNIVQSFNLLKQANEDKPLSLLPQIFTDYKRDEIINIFANNKTSHSDKEHIYNIVFKINASQNQYWEELKK